MVFTPGQRTPEQHTPVQHGSVQYGSGQYDAGQIDAGQPVRVAILGPVLIEGRDGAPVAVPGARAQAFIRALAMARTHSLSTASLIDAVWGDEPPGNARAALQTLVSRLRAVASNDLIASTQAGYMLATDAAGTDIGRARTLLEEARNQAARAPAGAAALVDDALAFWRGGPDDAMHEADSLRDTLLGTRARLRAELGRHEEALADFEALNESHPLDEQLVAGRMSSLAALGRKNDALQLFADFRATLRDELGASPSPTLVSINTALLDDEKLVAQPATAGLPHTALGEQRRVGLRTSPNVLLGRENDVLAIERLLGDNRLVTILGAGGLGKTRLAQAVGQRSTARAVIVVELASVGSDDDVTLAIATALGIRERSAGQRLSDAPLIDVRGRILDQLNEQDCLLIVDNCEHVVDGAARWIADILANTTHVRVLATSRSPLAIAAEQVYPLGPLNSGGDDESTPGPAVELFLARARAARPDAQLPLTAIADLCDRLDGLPLAIELAAARVRSMSVQEIDRRLGNRFALLTGGDRAAAERHRTLLAVIDWSWNLLSGAEQSALGRLSRFPDGFGADAAGEIVGVEDATTVADLLDGLVSQSLLGVSEDRPTGQLRYRMLETVREFGAIALQRAGEEESVQNSLFRWADHFCVTSYPLLEGKGQLERYRMIRLEHDNLLATLRNAIEARRPDVCVSVFAVLAQYWTMRSSHSEVAGFGAMLLPVTRRYRPGDDQVEVTMASYVFAGTITLLMNDRNGLVALGRMRTLLSETSLVSPRLTAVARFLLATAGSDSPDAAARVPTQLAEMRGDPDASVALVGNMITSQFAENNGDPVLSEQTARRAWELATASDDVWAASMAASMLAQIFSQGGDPETALDWAAKAETRLLALDADEDLRQLTWMRGMNFISLGRLDESRAIFDGFLAAETQGSQRLDLHSIGLAGYAEIARATGDVREAADRYAATVRAFETPAERSSPWFIMTTAALVSAWTIDGTGEPEELAKHARVLRSRVLALFRAQPGFVDKPVLGTAALGYSVWALSREGSRQLGLELLALAEGLHARQDLPVLNQRAHFTAAEEMCGAEAVARARAAVAALSPDERANRAHELFARPVEQESYPES